MVVVVVVVVVTIVAVAVAGVTIVTCAVVVVVVVVVVGSGGRVCTGACWNLIFPSMSTSRVDSPAKATASMKITVPSN